MKSPLIFDIDPEKGLVLREIRKDDLGPFLGTWRMGPSTSYLLTFERAERTPVSTAGMMVGDLLFTGVIKESSLIEFFNLLAENRRTGVLVVISGSVKRSIFFKDGDVRFASSNVENERLGSILYRFGFITEEQKEEVLRMRSPKHIGERLIEKGYLTASQLYKAIKIQIQEICYSTILLREGAYYFYELLSDIPSKIRFMARDLLMEGVRRMDELSYFKTKIQSMELVPVLVKQNWEGEEGISDEEKRLLGLVDGKRSLNELARLTKLGEFETLKIAYNLLQAGFIRLRNPARTPIQDKEGQGLPEGERQLARMLKVYSYVFRLLKRRAGSSFDVRQTLQSYLEQTGEPFAAFFKEHPLDDNLSLDGEALKRFLMREGGYSKLKALERVLRDAVQFFLFTAGLSLTEEVEAMLEEIGEELNYGG